MVRIFRCIVFMCILLSASCFSTATTLVFIGDSITDGNWGSNGGAPSSQRIHDDFNHIFGHGFMEMTAGYFMGTYPELDLKFHNRGIGGQTLTDIAARWQEDVIDLKPDVVFLLAGTNDVHNHLDHPDEPFSIEGVKNTLDSLILVTRKNLPEAKIIVGTPFVARSGWVGKTPTYNERERLVKGIANAFREVASTYDLTIVPFDTLVAGLVKDAPRPEYWIWDGIHPTTATHYRMSQLVIPVLSTTLSIPAPKP